MCKRLNDYRNSHDAFMDDCREEYGYGHKVRVKAVAIPRPEKSTFVSHLLTLAIFGTLILCSINTMSRYELVDSVKQISPTQSIRGMYAPTQQWELKPR